MKVKDVEDLDENWQTDEPCQRIIYIYIYIYFFFFFFLNARWHVASRRKN